MKEFWTGLATSLKRPHFAIAIWLSQGALAAVLALPISNFLHAELNHSPAGASMITSPDYRWWKTASRTHPGLLGDLPEAAGDFISADGSRGFSAFDDVQGAGAAFLGLGLFGVVLHAFLLGGVFGSLADERGNDLTIFAREGARRLPAFLIVTIGAAGLCVVIYHYLYYVSGRALEGFSRNLSTEGAALSVVAVRVLALLVALTLVKISADAIRVALVERPDLPPVTRYLVGIGSALGRLPKILAILHPYMATTAILFFLWSRLSVKSAATTTGGVVLLVAAQQVFVFLRSILKVGYYAGIREAVLQRAEPKRSAEPALPYPDAAS